MYILPLVVEVDGWLTANPEELLPPQNVDIFDYLSLTGGI